MVLSFVFISFVSIYAIFIIYSAQPGATLKKATSFTVVHVSSLFAPHSLSAIIANDFAMSANNTVLSIWIYQLECV